MGSGALGCGGTLMKYILFIFNFILFCAGGALFGISIWLMVDEDATDFQDLVNNNSMKVALIVLLCVGIFIFLVGFLGCCGACKESSTMLCLYAGLLVIVFIGEITAAILAIVFQSQLDETLQDSMSKQVTNDVTNDPTSSIITQTWFRTQISLKCCGGKDFTDYQNNNAWGKNATFVIPKQCCKLTNSKDKMDPVVEDYATCKKEAKTWNATGDFDQLYSQGCYSSLKDWLKSKTAILIGIGFGLAAVQVFGIVFACCVRNELKEKSGYN